MNREAWLQRVVRALRPRFKATGHPLPEILPSVGWPTGRGAMRDTDAECWLQDGAAHLFVSPALTDGLYVAGCVFHELVHAALPPEQLHHGRAFEGLGRRLGLVGAPKKMHPGKALRAELAAIVERVGPYPHRGLRP